MITQFNEMEDQCHVIITLIKKGSHKQYATPATLVVVWAL